MKRKGPAYLRTFACIVLAPGLFAAGVKPQTICFAAEQKGVICGFSEVSVSTEMTQGREWMVITEDRISRISLMGVTFDVQFHTRGRVDPRSGNFDTYESEIIQGPARVVTSISVSDGSIRIDSEQNRKKRSLPLNDGVILENAYYYPYLVHAFSGKNTQVKLRVFNTLDGKVDEKWYSFRKNEDEELADENFHALIVDELNRTTGAKVRLWIDGSSGFLLKAEYRTRTVFRSNPARKEKVAAVEVDNRFFVPAGKMIDLPTSVTSRYNPVKFNIIDYRVEAGPPAAIRKTEDFKPYLGEYTASFDYYWNVPFTVQVSNGGLAVNIPGKMLFELKERDGNGNRFFKVDRRISVSFKREDDGRVAGMFLTIRNPLPRLKGDECTDLSVPAALRPLIGRYAVPMENKAFSVEFHGGGLVLLDPGTQPAQIIGPDERGGWAHPGNSDRFEFERDATGKVTALLVIQNHYLPRGRPAAAAVEDALLAGGADAVRKKLAELKKSHPEGLFFSEAVSTVWDTSCWGRERRRRPSPFSL